MIKSDHSSYEISSTQCQWLRDWQLEGLPPVPGTTEGATAGRGEGGCPSVISAHWPLKSLQAARKAACQWLAPSAPDFKFGFVGACLAVAS